tara:strand:- start:1974 stop:2765 length:792 start_codon:yes stop_codon:yes gene_type:complete
VCDPVIGGTLAGVGAATSAFGGLKAASDQKTAEVNNYKRKLGIRRVKWDGQRALYGTRVAEYETTLTENLLSASRAYADEQSRLNDIFDQASVQLQDAFDKLAQSQKDFGSGKTSERLESRNLAKFGRNQALMASNLIRARESYQSNVESIRERLRATNRNAYSKVQFKPQPGFAPVKPNTDMTAANMAFLGGIASAAASGISVHNQLKPPEVGNMGGFGVQPKTSGMNFYSQDINYNPLGNAAPTNFYNPNLFTSGTNFFNP